MMMNIQIKLWSGIGILFIILSCSSSPKAWVLKKSIDLKESTPIGITVANDTIWVADGDHNRLLLLDTNGELLRVHKGVNRPMHIDSDEGIIYIPEYGSDRITTLQDTMIKKLSIPKSLDAPAGISVVNGHIAIADFYHHQIHYFDQNTWQSFGTQGHEKGQLYYPTDVQIVDHKIYVADAYNHRVQVFDTTGKVIQTIGEAEGMKVTTGLFVTEDQIFVTDFEQHRVLVYLNDGSLHQIITSSLNKPTDVVYKDGELWITNYGSKNITIYH